VEPQLNVSSSSPETFQSMRCLHSKRCRFTGVHRVLEIDEGQQLSRSVNAKLQINLVVEVINTQPRSGVNDQCTQMTTAHRAWRVNQIPGVYKDLQRIWLDEASFSQGALDKCTIARR
jgi:hypothetical protein